MDKVTFKTSEFIYDIQPPENLWKNGSISSYNLEKSPIFNSQYHHHYGHCLTIDISTISKENGRFLEKNAGGQKTSLQMKLKTTARRGLGHLTMGSVVFMHNGTNIEDSLSGLGLWNKEEYDVSRVPVY